MATKKKNKGPDDKFETRSFVISIRKDSKSEKPIVYFDTLSGVVSEIDSTTTDKSVIGVLNEIYKYGAPYDPVNQNKPKEEPKFKKLTEKNIDDAIIVRQLSGDIWMRDIENGLFYDNEKSKTANDDYILSICDTVIYSKSDYAPKVKEDLNIVFTFMDISSAPKDGQVFLAIDEYDDIHKVTWSKRLKAFVDKNAEIISGLVYWTNWTTQLPSESVE